MTGGAHGVIAMGYYPNTLLWLHFRWSHVSFNRLHLFNSHYLVSELFEEGTLDWFSHVVRNHLLSGAPFNTQFLVGDPVCYKEVSDVGMLRAFTA
jgi:hypothetical protein